MFVFSFLSGVVGLLLAGLTSWTQIIFYPLIAAPFAALTELLTQNGDDTVTVPLVTATVISILSFLF